MQLTNSDRFSWRAVASWSCQRGVSWWSPGVWESLPEWRLCRAVTGGLGGALCPPRRGRAPEGRASPWLRGPATRSAGPEPVCASQVAWWFFQFKTWCCDMLTCKTWARAQGPSPSPSLSLGGSEARSDSSSSWGSLSRRVKLRSQHLCVLDLQQDPTPRLTKQPGPGRGLPAGGAPGLGGVRRAAAPRLPVLPTPVLLPEVPGTARGACCAFRSSLCLAVSSSLRKAVFLAPQPLASPPQPPPLVICLLCSL